MTFTSCYSNTPFPWPLPDDDFTSTIVEPTSISIKSSMVAFGDTTPYTATVQFDVTPPNADLSGLSFSANDSNYSITNNGNGSFTITYNGDSKPSSNIEISASWNGKPVDIAEGETLTPAGSLADAITNAGGSVSISDAGKYALSGKDGSDKVEIPSGSGADAVLKVSGSAEIEINADEVTGTDNAAINRPLIEVTGDSPTITINSDSINMAENTPVVKVTDGNPTINIKGDSSSAKLSDSAVVKTEGGTATINIEGNINSADSLVSVTKGNHTVNFDNAVVSGVSDDKALINLEGTSESKAQVTLKGNVKSSESIVMTEGSYNTIILDGATIDASGSSKAPIVVSGTSVQDAPSTIEIKSASSITVGDSPAIKLYGEAAHINITGQGKENALLTISANTADNAVIGSTIGSKGGNIKISNARISISNTFNSTICSSFIGSGTGQGAASGCGDINIEESSVTLSIENSKAGLNGTFIGAAHGRTLSQAAIVENSTCGAIKINNSAITIKTNNNTVNGAFIGAARMYKSELASAKTSSCGNISILGNTVINIEGTGTYRGAIIGTGYVTNAYSRCGVITIDSSIKIQASDGFSVSGYVIGSGSVASGGNAASSCEGIEIKGGSLAALDIPANNGRKAGGWTQNGTTINVAENQQ